MIILRRPDGRFVRSSDGKFVTSETNDINGCSCCKGTRGFCCVPAMCCADVSVTGLEVTDCYCLRYLYDDHAYYPNCKDRYWVSSLGFSGSASLHRVPVTSPEFSEGNPNPNFCGLYGASAVYKGTCTERFNVKYAPVKDYSIGLIDFYCMSDTVGTLTVEYDVTLTVFSSLITGGIGHSESESSTGTGCFAGWSLTYAPRITADSTMGICPDGGGMPTYWIGPPSLAFSSAGRYGSVPLSSSDLLMERRGDFIPLPDEPCGYHAAFGEGHAQYSLSCPSVPGWTKLRAEYQCDGEPYYVSVDSTHDEPESVGEWMAGESLCVQYIWIPDPCPFVGSDEYAPPSSPSWHSGVEDCCYDVSSHSSRSSQSESSLSSASSQSSQSSASSASSLSSASSASSIGHHPCHCERYTTNNECVIISVVRTEALDCDGCSDSGWVDNGDGTYYRVICGTCADWAPHGDTPCTAGQESAGGPIH